MPLPALSASTLNSLFLTANVSYKTNIKTQYPLSARLVITNVTPVKVMQLTVSNALRGELSHLYVNAILATTINPIQTMISVMTMIASHNAKLVNMLSLPV